MTNRILLGNGRGATGLWVSKPGHDVLTTGEGNLLFSMNGRISSVLTSGSVVFPVNAAGQVRNIPLSGTGGVTPIVNIQGSYRINSGTEVTEAGALTYGATFSVSSNNIQIAMGENINYQTSFYYIVFLDNING